MDLKQIQAAIKQIALEKGLSEDSIMETLNVALAAAYRKDFGNKNQNITFKLDTVSGDMEVWDTKTVVDFEEEIINAIKEHGLDKKYVHGKTLEEEVHEERDGKLKVRKKTDEELDREMAAMGEEVIRYNPKTDILLEEAKNIDKKYKVGDEIVTKLEIPASFGRMAAQTAKQVIIQKLREAERGLIFEEYKDRVGEMINTFVQRREGRNVLVDMGKTVAIMPPEHQMRNERYNTGDRIKVYLASVDQTLRGPQIIVSRAHPQVLAKLFEQEIPEIESGAIVIKSIAREAGARSKVAVLSTDDSIDPIGSCVGQRGARIQTIIAELGGEKIDIIEYSEDPEKFIAQSLSPAKVVRVEIVKPATETEEGEALVVVPEDQLSLAIGKEGQNVRLAAKLTGWKINIMKEGGEAQPVAVDELDSESDEVDDSIDEEVAEELAEQAPADVIGEDKAE